jgi:hypothetical protein
VQRRTKVARAATIIGVAMLAAFLVGGVAVALRGFTPAASGAATTSPSARVLRDIEALGRGGKRAHLAAWHRPRVPHPHPAQAAPPRVVTTTTAPTVVTVPAGSAQDTQDEQQTGQQSGSGDDQSGDDETEHEGDDDGHDDGGSGGDDGSDG